MLQPPYLKVKLKRNLLCSKQGTLQVEYAHTNKLVKNL